MSHGAYMHKKDIVIQIARFIDLNVQFVSWYMFDADLVNKNGDCYMIKLNTKMKILEY